MLITCPNCLSQFSITDDIIPPEGKNLQCSVCLHTWHQTKTSNHVSMPEAPVPEQTESLFSLDLTAPKETELPEEFQPIKPKKHIGFLIFLILFLFISMLSVFVGYTFFHKQPVLSPDNAKDFSISNVQQELFVRSDDSTRIRLQGEILNISEDGKNLPPLKADIKTLEGTILETQILPSKKVYLQSGDSYLFFEDIISLYPPPLIVDVHF